MNNNIFNIDVVPEIPNVHRPGTIYINGLKYANQIPEDAPEMFLIAGEHLGARYLEEGANKDVVASVSMIHSVDSNKIYVVVGHPGYKFPEPDDVTRYYLDSTTNSLYTAIGNPRVNGYRRMDGVDEAEDDRPYVVYQDDPALPIIYVYTNYTIEGGAEIDNVKVLYADIKEGDDEPEYPWNDEYAPSTVITVGSMEELYNLTPNFLGVYKVITGEGPVYYVYNPYNLVEQDYFNFNCDVIY